MKGVSKVIEVLISVALLLIAYFTLFYSFGSGENVEEIWKIRGMQALKTLDDSGVLADLALNGRGEEIEEALAPLLPIGLNYKVLICEDVCPNLNIDSEKVVSVSYFVAGNFTHLEPREILLYMW